MPIAGCEILTAYAEFTPLLEAGIAITQGGTCRMGISDCDRLATRSGELGRRFVPYGFVSTLYSTAANIQVCAAHDNVPVAEHTPPAIYPHMIMRGALATPEPPIVDGAFVLPGGPGLGLELDEDALARFRV